MSNEIIIRKSRKKAVIFIVASGVLGIVGGLAIRPAHDPATGWMVVIAAFLALLYGLSSFNDRKPYVILTEEGITEMFTVRERIEWDAIRYVDDFWYRGQSFVRLILNRYYKPELIRPAWFRRFDGWYAQNGLKAIYIQSSHLEVDSRLLARFIGKMAKSSPAERIEYIRAGLPSSKTVHRRPETDPGRGGRRAF